MTYELGIDVGTSFTAAAVRRGDGAVEVAGLGPIADNIPTVLYLGDDGPMLVGDAANRRASIDPPGAAREFKRRMGDPTPLILRTSPFSAEALVGRMLDHVVQRVADRERGPARHVVATHPANWGPYKLELFAQSLRTIDAPSSLLPEPQAAAVAYAAQTRVASGSIIAIYDLGGGTFDSAILRKTEDGFEMLGDSVGIEHLGGVDFDEAIFQYVRQAVGNRWPSDPDDPSLPAPMLHLRRSCTEAKELLSTEQQASIPVMLPGVDTTVVIRRAEFEHMIAPRIDDSVLALQTALAAAGVGTEQLATVLLVGGSSRIPLVGSMLRERFGPIVSSDVDPLYAVARGAAIVAASRAAEADAAAPMPIVQAAAAAASPVNAPPGAPVSSPAAQSPAAQNPAAQIPATSPPPPPPPSIPLVPAVPAVAAPQAPPPAIAAPEPVLAAPVPGPSSDGMLDVSIPSAPSRSGRGRLIAAAAAAVLLLGGIAYVAVNRGGDDDTSGAKTAQASDSTSTSATSVTDSSVPASTVPASTVPAKPTVTASGKNMIAIPAGNYALGADKPENNSSESITRRVDVAAFSIDRYEVTNEEFKTFVDQTQASAPLAWPSGRWPSDQPRHPVQGVNYEWASAYCTALGKRLPTEAEWEVAARGPSSTLYPWGNDLTQVILPDKGTYDVGSVEGNRSGFGVFDLSGNVWEWVADSYDTRLTAADRILRGGQNGYVRKNVTRLPVDPKVSNSVKVAGFRCAASVTDPDGPVTFGEYIKPPAPVAPEPPTLAEGVLVQEEFQDSTSGWVETNGEKKRSGYHPNEYFHLETKAPNEHVLVIAPSTPQIGKLVDVTTKAFPEPDLTDAGGTFDYGVAFAFENLGRGLVFVVSPRTNQWRICNRNEDESYGVLFEGTRTIPDPIELSVKQVSKDTFEFRINGTLVTRQSIPGYEGTSAGLVLLSYANNKKAHIHYDSFEITEH